MANTIKLEIVTPKSVVYSEEVSMVGLPGRQGDMGIYPNHVPLMTKVNAGEIEVTREGQKELLAVGDGFAEIMPEKISILTDMAALEAEIDEAKAEEALKAGYEVRLLVRESSVIPESLKSCEQSLISTF